MKALVGDPVLATMRLICGTGVIPALVGSSNSDSNSCAAGTRTPTEPARQLTDAIADEGSAGPFSFRLTIDISVRCGLQEHRSAALVRSRKTLMNQAIRPFFTHRDLLSKMESEKAYSIKQLAKLFDASPSTIQRMLTTCISSGYVKRSPEGKKTYALVQHTDTEAKRVESRLQLRGTLQGYDDERQLFRDLCMASRPPIRRN